MGELQHHAIGRSDENWRDSWKKHFTLLRVGQKLVIKPSWIEYDEQPGDVVIDLDPGLAFGTGYHPTTYSCLEALEELIEPGHSVLDVGTGSGILSIAAAKLGAARITAVDIDGNAIRAALKNFRRTGISDLVNAESGSIPSSATRGRTYDLAIANISARGIRLVSPAIPDLMAPGGVFVASGIIIDQHDEAVSAIADAGMAVDEMRQREDWLTILCRRA